MLIPMGLFAAGYLVCVILLLRITGKDEEGKRNA